MIKAISQLLCPDKDREEWFSLGENHEKLLVFALHQLRNRYSQTRPQPRRESSRIVAVTVACGMVTLAVGCSRAPTFNILGSFFPSWILCGIIGLLLTVAARLFFVRIKLEQELSPLILVYPCLTAFFTFTLWLAFFS